MLRDSGVNARLAKCLNSVLNVIALVGTFNQEKVSDCTTSPINRFAALQLLGTFFSRSPASQLIILLQPSVRFRVFYHSAIMKI